MLPPTTPAQIRMDATSLALGRSVFSGIAAQRRAASALSHVSFDTPLPPPPSQLREQQQLRHHASPSPPPASGDAAEDRPLGALRISGNFSKAKTRVNIAAALTSAFEALARQNSLAVPRPVAVYVPRGVRGSPALHAYVLVPDGDACRSAIQAFAMARADLRDRSAGEAAWRRYGASASLIAGTDVQLASLVEVQSSIAAQSPSPKKARPMAAASRAYDGHILLDVPSS